MSSHSRFVRGSNRSAFRTPQFASYRTAAYLLISLALGVLFIYGADAHARDIEYMRAAGVTTVGTITELIRQQNGGRQPGYWMSGEYRAVSPSGRDLILPFRFNVTEKEFAALSVGQTVDLVYDPDAAGKPVRADRMTTLEPDAIRALSLAAAAVYAVIGVALSAADWRRRVRGARRDAKLRSAFGTR